LDGCNGLLVPLGDVAALAAAVIRLLCDKELAEEMGLKAREIARERFNEQTVFGIVKSEYRRLCLEKSQFAAQTWSQPT